MISTEAVKNLLETLGVSLAAVFGTVVFIRCWAARLAAREE